MELRHHEELRKKMEVKLQKAEERMNHQDVEIGRLQHRLPHINLDLQESKAAEWQTAAELRKLRGQFNLMSEEIRKLSCCTLRFVTFNRRLVRGPTGSLDQLGCNRSRGPKPPALLGPSSRDW